jgi:hypothetical protein
VLCPVKLNDMIQLISMICLILFPHLVRFLSPVIAAPWVILSALGLYYIAFPAVSSSLCLKSATDYVTKKTKCSDVEKFFLKLMCTFFFVHVLI